MEPNFSERITTWGIVLDLSKTNTMKTLTKSLRPHDVSHAVPDDSDACEGFVAEPEVIAAGLQLAAELTQTRKKALERAWRGLQVVTVSGQVRNAAITRSTPIMPLSS